VMRTLLLNIACVVDACFQHRSSLLSSRWWPNFSTVRQWLSS